MKLNLLTNAIVVDDAIRFVAERDQNSNRTSLPLMTMIENQKNLITMRSLQTSATDMILIRQ
jgi:hypothetical protein